MAGVGGEYRIHGRGNRPHRLVHIQDQGCTHIVGGEGFNPGIDAGVILRQIAGLLDKIGPEAGRQVYGMLAGAATYFENRSAIFKYSL